VQKYTQIIKKSGDIMPKFIILGIIIVIGVIVLGCNNILSNEKSSIDNIKKTETTDIKEEEAIDIQKGDLISFQLYKSYEVNTNGILERLNIVEDSPFTFFIQIKNFDNLSEYFIKEFYLEIPKIEFNYQDKYMAITIGRELDEIKFNGFLGEPYAPNKFAKVDITFAEEYHRQMMYVYIMDKIFLCDSLIGEETSFYIINGIEKEFYGHSIFDLNERKPWGESGV